ncbi:MAG TPA: glycosyltransferase family 4 protein, partial [Candidatus Cybelea sp.]|nr:glycosyltransferase family 4 protein [Candidatus Cybelea sp.]
LAVALRLAAVIRREGIDIIRATEPCYCGLIAMVTAMLTGRPWCVSLHADFDRRFALDGPAVAATVFGSRALANAIERLVISRAPMTLPIRESLIGYLKARGARADRIRVIPHGLDISVFATPSAIDVSARFDVPSGHRIVSFVGRLARDNYIDDVLDVARHIAATRGDVVMLMIGGGTEEARVRAEVSGNPGLARVVRMPGYQPRDVVAAVRQASAVSLCLMGGFSLIEACAAASPVVAYDVEWHGELVRDGETGYLIAEHDLAGLYVAVDRLLDRPDYARKLGQAAQHLALARHDHAASAAAKRKAYAELLELENRGVRCAFRRSAP